jgi:hypothetical protein
MNDSGTIVNKVAKSGLVTIDLERLFSPSAKIMEFDIKPFLFMELLLKEKDFRDAIDVFDFSAFTGSIVAAHCSSEAIIPEWAWMLVAAKAAPFAIDVQFGTIESVKRQLMLESAEKHDWTQYKAKKVLVKGCGDEPIPSALYMYATRQLIENADRLMYGEACSFVPVWRRS